MPGQDALRKRPGLVIYRKTKDDIVIVEIRGRITGRTNMLGIDELRDSVDRDAPSVHFVEPNGCAGIRRKEVLEAWINPAVPDPLEERVVRVRIIGLRPHPLLDDGYV